MLKTNSKKAKQNLQVYIINNFDCTNYDPDHVPETWEDIAKFIYTCFINQKYKTLEDKKYFNFNECNAFICWCSGLPSVLDTCYYYNRSAVKDVAMILEESEEEKNRYTEDAAELLLTKLIYREIKKAINK